MRMWMVDPKEMCRKHLLGEHVECHMFVGTLLKNKKVDGYVKKGLLEIHNLSNRHNELMFEMKRRGYKHNSLLPKFKKSKVGKINIEENILELKKRCKDCFKY